MTPPHPQDDAVREGLTLADADVIESAGDRFDADGLRRIAQRMRATLAELARHRKRDERVQAILAQLMISSTPNMHIRIMDEALALFSPAPPSPRAEAAIAREVAGCTYGADGWQCWLAWGHHGPHDLKRVETVAGMRRQAPEAAAEVAASMAEEKDERCGCGGKLTAAECHAKRIAEENSATLVTLDAHSWAREFCRLHGGDESLMVTWFANAIERGRDAGRQAAEENAATMAAEREKAAGEELELCEGKALQEAGDPRWLEAAEVSCANMDEHNAVRRIIAYLRGEEYRP